MISTVLHKTLERDGASFPRLPDPGARRRRPPGVDHVVIGVVALAISVVPFVVQLAESGGVVEACRTAVVDPWSPCGVDLPRLRGLR